MKKKLGQHEDDLNFWQPASDMLSALLLVLMLVILLLGLYLVHIPEEDQPDPFPGDAYDDGGGELGTETPLPTPFIWVPDGWDGGGGDWTPIPTHSVTPTVTVSPTPDAGNGGGDGHGEGDVPDEGIKSAVYVMLIDGETDRTVKESGVLFELYGQNHALQVLNSYYPERIAYRSYETTEAGTFYLPEKLFEGAYELHEMTEPEGYDMGPNLAFVVDEMYDWPEPYVVRFPVYPSRNVIRVQMTDAETGLGIPGGTFQVIAADNIITADGTLRYRTGQTVGEIVCDETGFGESEEIYLGQYLLRQRDIPPYYAGLTEDIEATVEKKASVAPETLLIASRRTRIRLTVTDELYEGRAIANAAFQVFAGGVLVNEEARTNGFGVLTLDSLDKGVTYRFRQVSAPGNYRIASQEITAAVAADGRIQGEAETEIALTNRMIRVAVGVTDEYSGAQVPGVKLTLYGNDGNLIRSWTSAGAAQTFEELAPGSYYLVKDGDGESRYPITVYDTAEVQAANIHATYVLRYVAMGGAGLAALGAGIGAAVILRRRKKKAGPQK